MATLQFYVDEDPQQDLSLTLGALGHDTISSKDAGTKGLSDARQLDFAVERGRVLITCNARDYLLIHEALVLWARRQAPVAAPPHFGILVVPNGNQMDLNGVTQIIDEFARSADANRVEGRLFEWRRTEGWVERTVP